MFPTGEPFGEATGARARSCAVALREKALLARGLPLCLLSLRVFPGAGQAAKLAQEAALAVAGCPAAPSSLPGAERSRAGVTKAEGKRGKAWERKEKQLMLEMARKEANSLNAPLAEILGKTGRSRAKLRDIVTPIGNAQGTRLRPGGRCPEPGGHCPEPGSISSSLSACVRSVFLVLLAPALQQQTRCCRPTNGASSGVCVRPRRWVHAAPSKDTTQRKSPLPEQSGWGKGCERQPC